MSILAHFTTAYTDKNGRRMPQAIAHRGAKAKFPENTMCAFKGAVATGVHALETDIHLTKDGVVVLSHVRPSPLDLAVPLLMTLPRTRHWLDALAWTESWSTAIGKRWPTCAP